MSEQKRKPVCFLCGEEKEGVDLSEYIEGEGAFACYECLADAAIKKYEGLHLVKSLFTVKRNWGFWLLIIGFILFMLWWFLIQPRIGIR